MQAVKLLALLCLPAFLGACGNMLRLANDLQESKETFQKVSVELLAPDCSTCPIVVAALGDRDGREVHAVHVYSGAGVTMLTIPAKARYIFAFHDLNHDFECQDNEARGWLELPANATQADRTTAALKLQKTNAAPRPRMMGNLYLAEMRYIQAGQLTRLDDERFSARHAETGMWQPLSFMRERLAGVYFLEAYSSKKTPVLFVHGINGTPQHFATLIEGLDREKYQPWLLYYPSGFDLDVLSDGLHVMMNTLHHRYGFNRLHIVAHSMGGLLARGYMQRCESSQDCDYLRAYVSLATPFGGNAAAASGVKYSPVVMPVWKSLAPNSDFLNGLYRHNLPKNSAHYLLFAYRNGGGLGGESGDGVIPLSSQLYPPVQAQAARVYGFNDGHMNILQDPEVQMRLRELLAGKD